MKGGIKIRYCPECNKTLPDNQFYTKRNGEKSEKCKFCTTMLVDNSKPETFIPILKEFDYPYVQSEWKTQYEKALKNGNPSPQSVLGKYLARMHLSQFSDKKFSDSKDMELEKDRAKKEYLQKIGIDEDEIDTRIQEDKALPKIDLDLEPKELPKSGGLLTQNELEESFDFTQEDKIYLVKKWGNSFLPSEYIYLEEFYLNMTKTYDIITPSHINYLENIAKVSLKMRQALEINDIDGYNKLARTYDMLMKSAKFTAAQDKSKEKDFVDSVGEFALLLEKTKGEIPRYNLNIERDIVDKTLMDYQRFVSKLISNESGLTDLLEKAIRAYDIEQENNANGNEEEADDIFNELYNDIPLLENEEEEEEDVS